MVDQLVPEVERAAALRRMKLVATGLLVLAALVFVAARAVDDQPTWLGYVQAFAEAAMVGALADWFAVTALFRHPLGVPIPHTAIIPKRKDQIGESLGEFVEGNFLTREVLDERLGEAQIAARLGRWLDDREHLERATEAGADALRASFEVLDDDEIQAGLERVVEARLRSIGAAPLLGRIIELSIESGDHQRLLDVGLTAVRGFVDDNQAAFRDRLQHESPWWIPESIDDRIFVKITGAIDRFLSDVGDDPDHEVRRNIEARARLLAHRLRTDPAMQARADQLVEDLLAHPEVRHWLSTLWSEAKRAMLAAADDPASELRLRMRVSIERFGRRLRDDAALRAKVDGWIAQSVGYLVDHYRHEVGDLIASTVARWDAESTSRRMELQVGRDLQFIRINGTLVGGLVGVVIHAAVELA